MYQVKKTLLTIQGEPTKGKWLTGPDFLSKGEQFWPASKFDDCEEQLAHDPEIKRSVVV